MMIKLLLVDDETVTRKGLIKHIPWKELGVDVVQDVNNGIEALEIARQFQPDIVITDILMPGVDGIRLGMTIREQFPFCKIIYISGYSDKEYLKAAIKISAVSYVEKPINISEAGEAIKKAVSMCNEDKKREMNDQNRDALICENLQHIKQDILNSLLCPKKDLTKMMKYLDIINIGFKLEGTYQVMMIKIHRDIEISNEESPIIHSRLLETLDNSLSSIRHISGSKDKDHIIAILSSDTANFKNKLESSFDSVLNSAGDDSTAGIKLFCAISHNVAGMDMIFEAYLAAEQAVHKAFFYGYNYIAFQSDANNDPCRIDESIVPVFTRFIEEGKEEEAVSLIENYCIEIKKHDNDVIKNIKNVFFNLMMVLLHESEKKNISLFETGDNEKKLIGDKISGCQTLQELKANLVRKTRSLFENKKEMKSSNSTVAEAMRYVQENYSDNKLSTKVLADHVYLTPTYLSSLFKKATGKTISEFIVEIRISKSKGFLLDYQSKLYEVARRVGYTDANYYAKIFKKVTGLNPSEYREKYVTWLKVS
jgi:two-component system response regulator YesN